MAKISYLDDDNERKPRYRGIRSERGAIFIVIFLVLSFVMGLLGGVGGLMAVSGSPYIKDKLGINLQNINLNRTTTNKMVLEESSAVIDAVKKVNPAVVSVTSSQNVSDFFGQISQQEGGGTGFIITNDGLILTNKHVAKSGDSLKVLTSDSKTYDAKVVAIDPTNDLAILKIDATGLPVVELGDSNNLQVGQWVIAVGNALGELQNTVTVGVISARERQLTAGSGNQTEQLNNLLQTDAAINPGNSGGPLVNLAGQVVGINTAIAGGAQGIGFAIPINQAKQAIESYKKTGKIIKPMLGVRYVVLNRQIAKQLNQNIDYGAYVFGQQGQDAVVTGSPADNAGLKSGDILLEINGEKITENKPLGALIAKYSPNDEVEIKYTRDKKESTIKVKLGSIE